jgi:hypothetical protein
MLAADPPPVIVAAPVEKPAGEVVVSRDTRSEVVASRDTPLLLVKAGRTEDALLRQAVFLTSTLSVVRSATVDGGETLRWSYQSYLQRQLCVTSITGQFSCAVAEVEELPEKSAGETPLPAAPEVAGGPRAGAEAARSAVAAALRTRGPALFDGDRRLKFMPMLRAAGVSIRQPAAPERPVRR